MKTTEEVTALAMKVFDTMTELSKNLDEGTEVFASLNEAGIIMYDDVILALYEKLNNERK